LGLGTEEKIRSEGIVRDGNRREDGLGREGGEEEEEEEDWDGKNIV